LAAREASLVAITLGGLLELLQSFTAYRSADWADLAADALGVVLAYGALLALDRAATQASA
jgi:VanZ family protein